MSYFLLTLVLMNQNQPKLTLNYSELNLELNIITKIFEVPMIMSVPFTIVNLTFREHC